MPPKILIIEPDKILVKFIDGKKSGKWINEYYFTCATQDFNHGARQSTRQIYKWK